MTHTIYEKNHHSFLCNVICIRDKAWHLKYWLIRIIIWSTYLHQFTSNRNTIYCFDSIKLGRSSNTLNICSICTMLNKLGKKEKNIILRLQTHHRLSFLKLKHLNNYLFTDLSAGKAHWRVMNCKPTNKIYNLCIIITGILQCFSTSNNVVK